MELNHIFEPISINGLTLKNRMVVSAMASCYCTADGMPTEKFMAYHERKARGGFGAIITEDFCVCPEAGAFKRLGGLWNDEQMEAYRAFTQRIHDAGAKIIVQLYHAGRQTSSRVTGVRCVAASAIKDPTVGETPHALTVDEIHALEQCFVDAAVRAKAAGFDGVEIHGAHGYLINQFASPYSNKRSDEYGGTTVNRARFATEVIAAVREAVGADFPIIYRMSSVEFVPGGLQLEETKVIARLVEEAGADLVHVSQGVFASGRNIIPPFAIPVAGFADHAAAIKQAVKVPVMAVGRINDPLLADTVIATGKADLCAMGRASLADPDMPNKAREGRLCDINRCIGCLQGCDGELEQGLPIRCLVNPLTGKEDEYDLSPVSEPRRVVVVGGGVSGCEAALVAAKRGHKVTLLERSQELGGQWLAAAAPLAKGDFTSFVVWQRRQLEQLGVDIRLGVEATREGIDALAPDAVILATGSNPAMPPIPGLREHGVVAQDVLRGRAEFGSRVVVIGGGLVGAETADFVAEGGSPDVTIVEMLPQIVKDGEPAPTSFLLERLAAHGVRVLTSAAVRGVEADAVVYEKDGEQVRLGDVDTVIVAIGARANTALGDTLTDAPYQVISVGDCNERAKNGYRGIQEGFEAGLRV